MMEDCLFCKILGGGISSEKVYEDEMVYAFNDIDPKAPVHVLIIPKAHAESIMDMEGKGDYLEAMFAAAREIAREKGIDEKGFRLVINTGDDGGQTVHHLHMHMLGGRQMEWPPG